MLGGINKLHGYVIRATDGEIGKVDEFYFDDASWRVRYLVADTGNWLTGRKEKLKIRISWFNIGHHVEWWQILPEVRREAGNEGCV